MTQTQIFYDYQVLAGQALLHAAGLKVPSQTARLEKLAEAAWKAVFGEQPPEEDTRIYSSLIGDLKLLRGKKDYWDDQLLDKHKRDKEPLDKYIFPPENPINRGLLEILWDKKENLLPNQTPFDKTYAALRQIIAEAFGVESFQATFAAFGYGKFTPSPDSVMGAYLQPVLDRLTGMVLNRYMKKERNTLTERLSVEEVREKLDNAGVIPRNPRGYIADKITPETFFPGKSFPKEY